ncbi:LuxR C-terminal-related transcriptional regulator [Streptomyces sclerotialus]|uniref:LuxR C-terminal-related transcriptional regulator n=1 Tax=Streptomyces sclerotialus TaxID=1957 RepID=UPI000AA0430C
MLPHSLRLFRYVSAHDRWTPQEVCEQLGMTADEVAEAQEELLRLGLLRHSEEQRTAPRATAPEAALLRLLAAEDELTGRLAERIRDVHGQIRELREAFLPLQLARAAGPGLDLVTGDERITSMLNDIVDTASSEVLAMHPGRVLPTEDLDFRTRRYRKLLERGVIVRSMHLHPMTRLAQTTAHLEDLRAAGAQVRLATALPFRLVVVDRVQALVPALHMDVPDTMMVVRGEELTSLLTKVFTMFWATATPLGSFGPGGGGTELTPQHRATLRLLAAGRKDEAVARELGISLRTLRRLTADLMARLGAKSRFQAGVEAVLQGLLD